MYQSTPFNLIGLPIESVNVIRISDLTVFETGLNKALFGSKLNGKLLVSLSVGITAIVLLNLPSVIVSVTISQLI